MYLRYFLVYVVLWILSDFHNYYFLRGRYDSSIRELSSFFVLRKSYGQLVFLWLVFKIFAPVGALILGAQVFAGWVLDQEFPGTYVKILRSGYMLSDPERRKKCKPEDLAGYDTFQ